MDSIIGCQIYPVKCFSDERGHFIEAYKRSEFSIPNIRQTNVSVSKKNVVRGLHFQKTNPQGKLVRSVLGLILDVVIDLRIGSENYGKQETFLLSPGGVCVYIPSGFAHGFWCLSEECVFHYGCTEEYHADSDAGINPTDPDLCLPWRNNPNIIISEKDRKLPRLKEIQSTFRMDKT